MTRLRRLIDRLPPPVRRTLRWGEHLLACIGAVLVVYHVGFELTVMISPSMSPTLQGTSRDNGDWILTERISYWFREPRRWEVVRFDMEDGTPVMKRVVGLPDETVALKKFRLLINEEVVPHPEPISHLKYYSYGNISHGRTFTNNHGYFVLGDDSVDSYDSRYEGTIPKEKIAGRVWLRVWPPSRFGLVHALN
jgi:signal peptidase I